MVMMLVIAKSMLILLTTTVVKSQLIVKTRNGLVQGKLVEDITLYYSYTGIPYAEPPTRNLRFKPPVPKKPWQGVLDATKFSPVCIQPEKNYKKSEMSEDCLYLNVYVPANRNTKEPFPVLVHVTGGAFRFYSGDDRHFNGPQLLLQRDIVVVTMNFRLGSLGYLSLNKEKANGNAGIKDAILSFKWVTENIAYFNGDPNNITVSGTSTGSVMLNYIMLTDKANNLFQRSIFLSGTAISFRSLALHPLENALTLGEYLQLNTSNTDILLQQLLDIDAFRLIEAENEMSKNDTRKGFREYAPFVPCIEIESEHAVITKHPLDLMRSGMFQDVTTVVIVSSEDGMLTVPTIMKDHKLLTYLNEDLERCIPSNIEYPYGSNPSIQLANSIRYKYFNASDIPKNSFDGLISLIGDTQFFYPINTMVKLLTQNKRKDLYYGEFSFDGELNWGKLNQQLNLSGTDHGDILGYIFVTKITKDILGHLDDRTQRVLDMMLTAITNFVKCGNPTPRNFMENPQEWEDYGKSNELLRLGEEPFFTRTEPGLYPQYWKEVYDQYYEYKANGGEIEKKIVP